MKQVASIDTGCPGTPSTSGASISSQLFRLCRSEADDGAVWCSAATRLVREANELCGGLACVEVVRWNAHDGARAAPPPRELPGGDPPAGRLEINATGAW